MSTRPGGPNYVTLDGMPNGGLMSQQNIKINICHNMHLKITNVKANIQGYEGEMSLNKKQTIHSKEHGKTFQIKN